MLLWANEHYPLCRWFRGIGAFREQDPGIMLAFSPICVQPNWENKLCARRDRRKE